MIAGETIAIDGAKSRAHNGKKSNFNQKKIDKHLEYIEVKTQENLILLRVDQDHGYAWNRTRKGGWAVAQSPILNTTITLKRLKQRGHQFTSNATQHLRIPWFILSEAEGLGGLRGTVRSIGGGAVYSIG